jgi:hypothetical protein
MQMHHVILPINHHIRSILAVDGIRGLLVSSSMLGRLQACSLRGLL